MRAVAAGVSPLSLLWSLRTILHDDDNHSTNNQHQAYHTYHIYPLAKVYHAHNDSREGLHRTEYRGSRRAYAFDGEDKRIVRKYGA